MITIKGPSGEQGVIFDNEVAIVISITKRNGKFVKDVLMTGLGDPVMTKDVTYDQLHEVISKLEREQTK